MRGRLAGSRLEVEGLEQKLSLSQSQLFDYRQDIRGLQVDNANLKEMVLATKSEADGWKVKARRRGWIIGLGVGVPAAYGVFRLVSPLL